MAKKKLETPLTLNGKEVQFTDSWLKMSFTQYLRILKLTDDKIELISILTGLDYDYLKKAKITGLESILYKAQFLNEPPQFHVKPTHIGPYKLPLNSEGIFDIQFESLAQFEDMRQIMTKLEQGIHAHTEAYAKYCAIYLQKLRDGQYDGDKALAMVPEVMLYPASDVIVAGGFFFVKLQSLSTGTQSSSQSSAPHRKKSTGKRSKRSSGRTRPSIKSRGR